MLSVKPTGTASWPSARRIVVAATLTFLLMTSGTAFAWLYLVGDRGYSSVDHVPNPHGAPIGFDNAARPGDTLHLFFRINRWLGSSRDPETLQGDRELTFAVPAMTITDVTTVSGGCEFVRPPAAAVVTSVTIVLERIWSIDPLNVCRFDFTGVVQEQASYSAPDDDNGFDFHNLQVPPGLDAFAWDVRYVWLFPPGPLISSFEPTTAAVGDSVTLRGSNLTNVQSVEVRGISTAFTPVSDSELTFTVPPGGLGQASVVVTTVSGYSPPESLLIGNRPALVLTPQAAQVAWDAPPVLDLLVTGMLVPSEAVTARLMDADTNTLVTAFTVATNGTFPSVDTRPLPPGTRRYYVEVPGNSANMPARSQIVTVVVERYPTSLVLGAGATTIQVGDAVELSATLTRQGPGTPGGGVVFTLDGAELPVPIPLQNGAASLTATPGNPGILQVAAAYVGDDQHQPATAPVLEILVEPRTTVTGLTVHPASAVIGTEIILRAQVEHERLVAINLLAPGGTVEFHDSASGPLGSAPVQADGVAELALSSLPVGVTNIIATYAGDTNNQPSTSTQATATVLPRTTALLLGADATTVPYGNGVRLTATLGGAVAPNGSVEFLLQDSVVGTGAIEDGQARFDTGVLPAGSYAFTARYAEDANGNGASTSVPLVITVQALAGPLELRATPNPALSGEAVRLTALLTGVDPTGTVSFEDALGNVLGTAAIVAGEAGLEVSGLGGGTHELLARYQGDANHDPAVSNMILLRVDALATSVNLEARPAVTTVGEEVVLSVTVTQTSSPPGAPPRVPTGTVEFHDDAAGLLGSAVLSGGTAELTLTTLPPGARRITALYLGDADNEPSSSAEASVTIEPRATNLRLELSADIVAFGEAVAAAAHLTGALEADGTVEFLADGALLAFVPVAPDPAGGYLAQLSITALPVGTHELTASYGGDGNGNADTTSEPVTLTVQALATSVTLVSSLNPATVGQPVTFTARVEPAGATGSVTFGGLGAEPLTITLDGGGGSLATTGLPVGTHEVTASYSGDAVHAPAISPVLMQVVAPAAAETADAVELMIQEYLLDRAALMLASQPDLARRMARLQGSGGSVTGLHSFLAALPGAAEGRGVDLTLSATNTGLTGVGWPVDFDLWLEGGFAVRGAASATDGLQRGAFGLDYRLSDGLLIGAFVQFDRHHFTYLHDDGVTTGTASGRGWLAGPYLTARILPSLYVDVLVAAGRASNEFRPFGSYVDTVPGSRWLVSTTLNGGWSRGDWTFTPAVALAYWQESTAAYTDSGGTSIAGQGASQLQVRGGPGARWSFSAGDGVAGSLALRLDATLDLQRVAGGAATTTVAGNGELALNLSLPQGAALRLSAARNGLWSGEPAVTSVRLSVSVPY